MWLAACGFYTEGARWVFCSVDRVFRNETMDATHLCEFHQVEGVVLDYNLCVTIHTLPASLRHIHVCYPH